jgi:hypothetical protein
MMECLSLRSDAAPDAPSGMLQLSAVNDACPLQKKKQT